jgi:hypothetical protein
MTLYYALQEIEATWECLLQTLFDLCPEILEFYEAWGTEYFNDHCTLHICSSMGIVIQRLSQIPSVSQSKTQTFIHRDLNPRTHYWAATIALRLLGCR